MDELEDIRKKKIDEFLNKAKVDKIKIEIQVDDTSFDELVIEQSKKIPIIVDFWATWCNPCVMLSPLLSKFANEYKGQFVLAKVNVADAPLASQKYAVQSIPSVKLFKNGKIVDDFVGALPEPLIRAWINKNLGKDE